MRIASWRAIGVAVGIAIALGSATSQAAPGEDDATDSLLDQFDEEPAKPTPKEEPKSKEEPKPEPKPKPEPEPEPEPEATKAEPEPEATQAEPEPEPKPEPKPKPKEEPPKDPGKSHHKMGSIYVSAGGGFLAIVPYKDDIFCGEFSGDDTSDTRRKTFCTQGAPWFMEFTGMYGVHPRLDIVLGLRLNVQRRDFRCRDSGDLDTCKGLFNQSLGVGFFPGIRAWFSRPERIVKVGGGVDFMVMFENFRGYRNRNRCNGPDDNRDGPCPLEEGPLEDAENDVGNSDVGLRLGPLLQIDPHRHVGIYLQPAARMGLLRWFEFAFEVSLGIGARFP